MTVERTKSQSLHEGIQNFEANPPMIGSESWCALGRALLAYEGTGDHDHGWNRSKPLLPGARCPGGDCLVDKARRLLLQTSLESFGCAL
jgi:hypothetical protein